MSAKQPSRRPLVTAAIAIAALGVGFVPGFIVGSRGPAGGDDALAAEAPADLDEIRKRGELRILVAGRREPYLPRNGSPREAERRLARDLASELGVEPRFIAVESYNELLPSLAAGRGDIVAENMTLTPERAQAFAFSAPLSFVREQVVVRADDGTVKRAADLAGRRLGVRASSSLWASAEALRRQVPELKLEALGETLDRDSILDALVAGEMDATIADGNFIRASLAWRDDIRIAFELPERRVIAWPMHPRAHELRKAVDRFLARTYGDRNATPGETELRGDLAGIRERGVLRVLTRNSDTTYFVWRGEILGFEYELARRFAKSLKVDLEMVVPPSRQDLIPWLRAGRGDVVAAGLTASDQRSKREGIAFSRRYLGAVETLVARVGDSEVNGVEDLSGRQVVVRRSSAYWDTLGRLLEEGAEFERVAAPEFLETEEILARVASGEYDLTVADSPILEVARAWQQNLRGAFALGEEVDYGWAVRGEDAELLAAIDGFFDQKYRGLFYNVLLEKYFQSPRKIQARASARPHRSGQISPYDDLARRFARQYGFDWRLIVAQMYQESEFDPKARSFAGARGLLQVMPRTARELGFNSVDDPEAGLEAGVRYLDWTRDRFEPDLPPNDRLWFSLAAYNVGFGHVNDARRIAASRGLDPDRWFEHVEQAMLLKERPEVHRKTRFGFARGREPVGYVRDIRDRYAAYLEAFAQDHPTPAALARQATADE